MATAWRVLASVAALCAGAACWAQAGIDVEVLREVLEPSKLPSGRYVPVQEWEAETAGRLIGRPVADRDASKGRAVEAVTERDDASRHLLFGPYLDVPEGDYVAFFRLKVLEDVGEEVIAEIDAVGSYGQDAARFAQLHGTSLRCDRYVQVPLPFHFSGKGLECRVLWRGYAGLRADKVTLYRLEGGILPPDQNRAPAAVPSGEPANLTAVNEPRPFPDIFPRSAEPAPQMTVCDIRRIAPDEQMLYLTLQGLVNRSTPRLYLLYGPNDQQWLDHMRKRGWVKAVQTVRRPADLLKRFGADFHGAVVSDPLLPVTKNVATMLAGLRGAVVASPRLAQRLKLPVVEDLRGRWRTGAAATEWAFDTLWPRLNHHVIACSWPDHLGLRDYLVQHRVFIFWISGPIDGARPGADPTAEIRLMERLLARMPANIPVMSYPWAAKDVGIGEGPGVTLFAEFGKYLVGSIDTTNLSVHSGVRIDPPRRPAAPPAPALNKDRIYAAWVISDGDNLPVLTNGNFPQLWRDPVRGAIPIGWTLTPSAVNLIPGIVDYYYSSTTPNDDWMTGVSGIGYTYPDSYGARFTTAERQRIYDGFLEQTDEGMRRADLQAAWIMGIARQDLLARYARNVTAVRALYPDYGRRVPSYAEATYTTSRGVPVFRAFTEWAEGLTREAQMERVIARLKAVEPRERPAFIHMFVLNWFADLPMLQEIQRRLGPAYEFVRPDHLAALYNQEMAERLVTVRLPDRLIAVEGRPLRFTLTAQNVGREPVEVQPLVLSGIQTAFTPPPPTRLAPGETTEAVVDGVPTTDSITVGARGAFGERRSTATVRTVPLAEIAGELSAGAMRPAMHLPAIEQPHTVGRAVDDPDAVGGRAWSVTPGVDKPGHPVYGPYAPLKAGRYVALFRVRRTGPGSGPLLHLDTALAGGKRVTAEKDIRTEDLSEKYRSYPLAFTHPGGEVECRVQWTGAAGVHVDGVTLWELE